MGIYFGSVRFFKQLIVLFAALFVVSVIAFAVYFFCFREKGGEDVSVLSVTQALDADGARFADAAKRLKEGSAEEFNRLCEEKGLSPQEILGALEEREPGLFEKAEEPKAESGAETPAYTKLFPELYVTPPTVSEYHEKTLYFTFDDGPSVNTDPILDTLQEYDIKATFFVVPAADGSQAARLKRVADGGHTIGVHSATHEYEAIYADVESYLEDFGKASNLIFEATGQKPDIFRFPGGSINSYNRLVYQQIIAEMTRRGYTYFDWHTDGNEYGGATPESVYTAVKDGVNGMDRAVVLLHDGTGRWQAAEVFEQLVIDFTAQGYSFDKLTNRIQPITFGSAS